VIPDRLAGVSARMTPILANVQARAFGDQQQRFGGGCHSGRAEPCPAGRNVAAAIAERRQRSAAGGTARRSPSGEQLGAGRGELHIGPGFHAEIASFATGHAMPARNWSGVPPPEECAVDQLDINSAVWAGSIASRFHEFSRRQRRDQ